MKTMCQTIYIHAISRHTIVFIQSATVNYSTVRMQRLRLSTVYTPYCMPKLIHLMQTYCISKNYRTTAWAQTASSLTLTPHPSSPLERARLFSNEGLWARAWHFNLLLPFPCPAHSQSQGCEEGRAG